MYNEEDYIEVAEVNGGFGYGRYKYRVMDRNGFPNHHTDDLEDAKRWFRKCRDYWIKQDQLSRE